MKKCVYCNKPFPSAWHPTCRIKFLELALKYWKKGFDNLWKRYENVAASVSVLQASASSKAGVQRKKKQKIVEMRIVHRKKVVKLVKDRRRSAV